MSPSSYSGGRCKGGDKRLRFIIFCFFQSFIKLIDQIFTLFIITNCLNNKIKH